MQTASSTLLDRQIIMAVLNREANRLATGYHVRKLGLFGSFAQGDERPDSDIDVLVVMEPVTFDNYMDLKYFLEDLFGRPVDLVLEDSLKPRLRQSVPGQVLWANSIGEVAT